MQIVCPDKRMKMNEQFRVSRRLAVKSAVFGFMAVSVPSVGFSKSATNVITQKSDDEVFYRYPAINDEVVGDFVRSAHFDLDKIKKMVEARPDLARATWDWGFGDWETAIGAASHVGRRDIVEVLIAHGARPDIFTYAMLGANRIVQAMIETTTGVHRIAGPHGISLLQHVKNGLRGDGLSEKQKAGSAALIDFLEGLEDNDPENNYLELSESDLEKYKGTYKYGAGDNDGFLVEKNRRNKLSLIKLGEGSNLGGGDLNCIGQDKFTYNGIAAVDFTFIKKAGNITALVIQEPELTLTALKK